MKIKREIARNIIEHHFGKLPREIEDVKGGFANFVYLAKINKKKYIVRISDEPSKIQSFMKEQWAVQKALENKIPVPNILEVANEASKYPYMIVEYVNGTPALSRPSNDRLEIIKKMGKYTAIINSIPTTGYGVYFDWSSNELSHNDSWCDYLEKELKMEDRIAVFEKNKILDDEGISKLKSAFREMQGWTNKPSLNHGDMRLKNILVDEDKKICAILDWEMCISNIAPQWDLSIALHDLNMDEKDAFLDGYGLSPQEYRNRALGIKALNIINYAPFIERAYEVNDDRSKKYIDHMKTRLRGALDLYSV
jgi:aminoglycoside phosphotransferase (APT) family kinase protein